jgi:hypothetical protein
VCVDVSSWLTHMIVPFGAYARLAACHMIHSLQACLPWWWAHVYVQRLP